MDNQSLTRKILRAACMHPVLFHTDIQTAKTTPEDPFLKLEPNGAPQYS